MNERKDLVYYYYPTSMCGQEPGVRLPFQYPSYYPLQPHACAFVRAPAPNLVPLPDLTKPPPPLLHGPVESQQKDDTAAIKTGQKRIPNNNAKVKILTPRRREKKVALNDVADSTQTDDSSLLFLLDDLNAECAGSVECFKPKSSRSQRRHVATQLQADAQIVLKEFGGAENAVGLSYSDVLKGRTPQPPAKKEEILEVESKIEAGKSGKSKKKAKKAVPINHTKPNKAPIALFEFVPTSEKTGVQQKKQPELLKPKVLEKEHVVGNVLDTSEPVFHKGKTRDNPKEKPTTMKKIISREKTSQECGSSILPVVNDGVHSKRFREYCSNTLSPELDNAVLAFLDVLRTLQDKTHLKEDPVKFRLKRRYVCGLREVRKFVSVEKVCCMIVAPDMDKIVSPGGLDDVLYKLVQECQAQSVPVIFALRRRTLGHALHKSSPVACVGVLNIQGAQSQLKAVLELLEISREKLKERQENNPKLEVDVDDATQSITQATPSSEQ